MSILHVFVCDYCGNQNEVFNTLDRNNNQALSKPMSKSMSGPMGMPTTIGIGSQIKGTNFHKYESDQETKNSIPIQFLDVSFDISAIRHYQPNENMKSNCTNLSFCSKSCFVDFFQKYLTENGSIKMPQRHNDDSSQSDL
jgi:hypothetical protein